MFNLVMNNISFENLTAILNKEITTSNKYDSI